MCEDSEVPWCESNTRQEGTNQSSEGTGAKKHQRTKVTVEES
jgi:hypothetical protein